MKGGSSPSRSTMKCKEITRVIAACAISHKARLAVVAKWFTEYGEIVF